jgi:hypothetical protein
LLPCSPSGNYILVKPHYFGCNFSLTVVDILLPIATDVCFSGERSRNTLMMVVSIVKNVLRGSFGVLSLNMGCGTKIM